MRKLYAVLNLFGLVSGVLGGFLVYKSMILKPTKYKLGEGQNQTLAICFKEKKIATGFGGPLIVSDEPCPEASVAAAIEYENDRLVHPALLLIGLGFLLQVPAGLQAISSKG
jgi:hypothetical protein